MGDIVRVQDMLFSGTSCLFKIGTSISGASPWTGIVDISWEHSREPKVVYANRQDGRPIGWTAGKYEVGSFMMKMLLDSSNALKKMLSDQYGGYGRTPFYLFGSFYEPELTAEGVMSIVASPCRIKSVKFSKSEGSDELCEELSIACLGIIENGYTLYEANPALVPQVV